MGFEIDQDPLVSQEKLNQGGITQLAHREENRLPVDVDGVQVDPGVSEQFLDDLVVSIETGDVQGCHEVPSLSRVPPVRIETGVLQGLAQQGQVVVLRGGEE